MTYKTDKDAEELELIDLKILTVINLTERKATGANTSYKTYAVL